MKCRRLSKSRRLLGALLGLLAASVAVAEPSNEEGEFRIYFEGREIGAEKFIIIDSRDAVTSSSSLSFRNPADSRERIQLESRLEMNSELLPKSYLLKTEVEGKKGTIVGTFPPRQAVFEYSGSGTPRKIGVLTGSEFTVLDTNIFHHFILLARKFQGEEKGKLREVEVVIPQEADSGTLKISQIGTESLRIGGRTAQARHVRLDSGSLRIDLWIDGDSFVQKIAVPSRKIEVLRGK